MTIKEVSKKIVDDIMFACKKGSKSTESRRCNDDLHMTVAGNLCICDYDDAMSNDLLSDRDLGRLFDSNFLEKAGNQRLQDMWPANHEKLAMRMIESSSPGLGTPNAAAGAGELFLLFSSSTCTKPTKGDICFKNGSGKEERVELKRGGKIGSSVSYRDVNRCVVESCKSISIDHLLPRVKNKNSAHRSQPQFIPGDASCDAFIENLSLENRKKIWQAWWEAQFSGSLPECQDYLWNEIKWVWIKEVVDEELKETNLTCYLVILNTGEYLVWRSAEDVINYYKRNNRSPVFEFRAMQSNKPAFYVPS